MPTALSRPLKSQHADDDERGVDTQQLLSQPMGRIRGYQREHAEQPDEDKIAENG